MAIITKKYHPITKDKNTNEADTWEPGDILAGIFGSTMSLPHFFKIIKRTATQFTCIRLKGKIVSGHKCGQWEEIATDEPYDDKQYVARINKMGGLKIDDVNVHLWDGKPLYGDDMD